MQKFFSMALGGLVLATASLMVQGTAADAPLANKQGGEDSRLMKKMQKRGEKTDSSKESSLAGLRLANKQGGEDTRLMKKMQKRGQKADSGKKSSPVETQLA